MKKIKVNRVFKTLAAFGLMSAVTLGILPQPVRADNAPAYTYTISEDGKWVRTQDAYLTSSILFRDMGMKKPEDIFVKNGKIYVADTDGGRIAVMDKASEQVTFLGEEALEAPTSVFVDDQNNILAADYKLGKVAVLSQDGKVIKWYERPTSIVFGKNTNFKPRKAVSDKKGNIYIVGEGSYDGVIQLSKEGEFLGYFGANNTHLTALEAVQELIFTEVQKSKLFNRIPKTFNNIAIDNKGMAYTITQAVRGHAIKKHSVSGTDIFSEKRMIDEGNFVDLTIGKYGQVYALTETGLIYEYDSEGNLIFSFGGRAISTERNGLLTVGAGIAVDEEDNVNVLDKERGVVQVFYPTIFAEMTHEAITLFEGGKYSESKTLWQQILKLSGTSRIAHDGLGKAYFQESDYEKAAYHFKTAENREGYSESYWEIRNKWLQDNVGAIIVGLILLMVAVKVIKKLDAKKGIFDGVRTLKQSLLQNKLISDLIFVKKFIRHPINSMYDIRRDKEGSVLSATILYLMGFVIFTVNFIGRGFIFNYVDARNISYVFIISIFLLPCALWVAANYMVSSINEGEGRLKDVYIASAYSLAPFIIFMPFVIALSYVVTLNEAFVLSFSVLIIWVWCAVILFLGLKEIHNYEIKEVIKNILLSLFLIFVGIIIFSIIYMLWDQLIGFVYTFLKEVAYSVGK
jgi:tetratricopeptide (TPR) repeat protein